MLHAPGQQAGQGQHQRRGRGVQAQPGHVQLQRVAGRARQRRGVAREPARHCGGGEHRLQDHGPSHRPGGALPKGDQRVVKRAAHHRDAGRQLRVAQRRQRRGHRRGRVRRQHRGARQRRRGHARDHKDARAHHGADAQEEQVQQAQAAPQRGRLGRRRAAGARGQGPRPEQRPRLAHRVPAPARVRVGSGRGRQRRGPTGEGGTGTAVGPCAAGAMQSAILGWAQVGGGSSSRVQQDLALARHARAPGPQPGQTHLQPKPQGGARTRA